MPSLHTRNHNRCETPLFAVSRIRLHSMALVYMTSMLCVLLFILVMNYNRLDNLFREITTYQLTKFDQNIDTYMDLLKDKLQLQVAILEERVTHCEHINPVVKQGDTSVTAEDYLTNLTAIYNKHHSDESDIATIFFTYLPTTDIYVVPRELTSDNKIINTSGNDAIKYLTQFTIPYKGVNHYNFPNMPHYTRNVFKVISVENRWYLTTTIRYKNTHTYMFCVVNILSPSFYSWLSSPIYSPDKTGPIFYSTIQDRETTTVIFHPIYRDIKLNTLADLPRSVWTSDKGIVQYEFQHTTRYMISKEANSVPGWAISIIFNKGLIFKQVLYTNIPSILALLLFNLGMIYIYVTKIGNDHCLSQYKAQNVMCVGDGLCITEQIKCRDKIATYRNRIKLLNDLIVKREMASEEAAARELTCQINDSFKEIQIKMNKDIEKLSDTGYFIAEYKHKK